MGAELNTTEEKKERSHRDRGPGACKAWIIVGLQSSPTQYKQPTFKLNSKMATLLKGIIFTRSLFLVMECDLGNTADQR